MFEYDTIINIPGQVVVTIVTVLVVGLTGLLEVVQGLVVGTVLWWVVVGLVVVVHGVVLW